MFSVIFLHSIFLPEGYETPWTGIILGPSYDFTRPMAPVLIFFFLSGWLQRPSSRYLEWRKALLLFVPALVFWNGFQLLVRPEPVTSWEWALYKLGVLPGSSNIDEPLWFLTELMWFTFFLPLIHRIPISFRVCCIICLLWVADGHFNREVWGLNELASDAAFFMAGTVASQMDKSSVLAFFRTTSVWFVPVTLYLNFNYFLPGCLHYSLSEMMKSSAIAPIVALMSFFGASVLFAKFMPKIAAIVAGWAPAVFFMYASHWPVFTLYERLALHYGIPAPHPYIYPLTIAGYMLLCVGVWKLGLKSKSRLLHSIVFLQPIRKPEPGKP